MLQLFVLEQVDSDLPAHILAVHEHWRLEILTVPIRDCSTFTTFDFGEFDVDLARSARADCVEQLGLNCRREI